ncbi:hypothetical protein HIM_12172 [Hirsutella minnesotensis 3608]|uniref:HAT C-terminal dimerisation domain-containing protein n=1 Tax=Hirsutella minnesotensis 3608 TaxID=1043627 RepID=A0A0F7ZF32_9HYPO|nr:hypothetical protein HIM_12172 [Hirsutella minnesotensis 3608]
MNGWYALDKYYLKSDNSSAYAAALILNPACRKKYIAMNWKTSWQWPAFDSVKQLWSSTYRDVDIPPRFESNEEATVALDEYDLLEKDLDPPNLAEAQSSWWAKEEQQERYPRLAQMALDILSIPPMSAEPERVFSGARRQISWERMQLGAANVERKECLKSWVRSGITSDKFDVEEEDTLAVKKSEKNAQSINWD